MPIVSIQDVAKHDGQEVTLRGWLYNLREAGKLLFPIFRDGTGTIQGVVSLKDQPAAFESLRGRTQESSVIVTGRIHADKRAPGGFEIQITAIEVVQRVPDDTPYPIQLKEHGVDFLLDHRHLWIRTPRQASILRIRAEAVRAAHEYMASQDYILTEAPIFTPASCEGTTTLFEVQYIDDDKAYLTQSGQLYVEATAMALGKVYTFGPTFRAEKSKTRRHLTEFWMIEPEVAYLELDGLLELAENFITHIVTRVLEHHRADLKVIGRDVTKLEAILAPTSSNSSNDVILSGAQSAESKNPEAVSPIHTSQTLSATKANRFPRLSYDEAHATLDEAYKAGKLENPHKYGDDFGSPDETYISSQFDKPVMIHRYPAAFKAFYMQPDPKDPTKALCVDVLAPEGYGEIIGGSQRIDSYDLLKHRIEEHNLPLAAFQWYLDLRRYGSVPHAGFGMGIERVVAWLCGLDHVRETIPFARTLNRIYP